MVAAAKELLPIASCDTDGPCTVTGTVAAAVGLVTLVAVTVTAVTLLTVGAVNNPPEEIVPALALQITDVFAVLAKLAVNCTLAPDEIRALAGETVGMEVFELGALPACDPSREEQLVAARANKKRLKKPAVRKI